jgi:phospholipid N-methyltransferase
MNDHVTFLMNFLRRPTQVGAIAPSSPALVRTMIDSFDWQQARRVVEFGSGTGVFTEAIVTRLHPDARFFAIERSPELAAATRRRCPSVTVHQDSVTNIAELCRRESFEHVDAIVCGLPWASFSESLQTEIIRAMMEVLAPGGRFATFAYWQGVLLPAGRRFNRRLRSTFPGVARSPTAWRNLPPAFVYRCTKPHASEASRADQRATAEAKTE